MKRGIKRALLFLVILTVFLSIILFSRKKILSSTRDYRYMFEVARLKKQVSEKQDYEYHKSVGNSIERIAREWRNLRGYTKVEDLEAFGEGVYSYTSLLAEKGIIKDSFESASSHAVMIILNDDVYMTCEPAIQGYNAGDGDTASDLNIIGLSLFNTFTSNSDFYRSIPSHAVRNKYVSTFMDNLSSSFTIHSTNLKKSTTVTEVKNILEDVDNSTQLFFWEGHGCLFDVDDNLTLSYPDGVCYTMPINEKVTEENTKDYDSFLQEHSVVLNPSNDSYSLTNTFFEKYLKDTENGLFVSGCCYSDNEFLIDALTKHGFTSIACCKGTVTGFYARQMMNSIAEYLCKKDEYGRYLSLQYAYKQSIEEYGYGTYPSWGDKPYNKYMNLYESGEDNLASFRIKPESVITFGIYEKHEELVDNIEISLIDSDGNENAVEYHAGDASTAEGFWIRIPAGIYKYKVLRDGAIISEQEIDVPYQDEVIPITIDLDGYRISGRIVDSDNNPIEGAKVTLQDSWMNTDEDGYYIFTLQENREVSISVSVEGYNDYKAQINVENYKHTDILTLPDIVLTTNCVTFTGTLVSDYDDTPIESALVCLNGDEVKSNSDGSFIIKTAIADHYDFVIKADGYEDYSHSMADDASLINATITYNTIVLKKKNPYRRNIHNPRISPSGIESSKESGHKVTYDCVWFGEYPQTEIVGDAKQCGTYGKNFADTSDYMVDSSLYNELSNAANWDFYGDIVIRGTKYRRLKLSDTFGSYAKNPDYQYDWTDPEQYHFFRYDPIKWRVLNITDNNALLLSDRILDHQYFNLDTTYVSWANSTIRSWLNGYSGTENLLDINFSSHMDSEWSFQGKSFIESAFTDKQKESIIITTLDKNTEDRIYFFDYNDINGRFGDDNIIAKAKSYGFGSHITTESIFFDEDNAAASKSSTFAKAAGLLINDRGTSAWWLRSTADGDLGGAMGINTDLEYGWHSDSIYKFNQGLGCRPVIHLHTASSEWSYAGTVCTDGTVIPANTENANASESDQSIEDAEVYNNHTYKVFDEQLTWDDANKRCKEKGGHLVTITDAKEQEFIQSIANGKRLWIGASRGDNVDTWSWCTGEAWEYTNWSPGEPNNSSNVISNENRVALWNNKWNDLNNDSKEQSGYICEWDMP